MTKKENRVAGIIGIAAYKSNFNADFEGNPRSNNLGFDASHVSLKYPIRKYLENRGHRIYYMKELSDSMEFLKPKEKYEKLFDTELKKNDKKEVLKNLLECVDVHNFGATFAESGNNIGITGATQFSDGINIYEDAEINRVSLLNPFVNSKSTDANQTTLGSRAVLDEAHFVFNFTVNPNNYDQYVEIIDDFEGYTEENYQLFKEASLSAVTEYQSVAKAGCENEFALFVNFKKGSLKSVANLHMYVNFYKENDIGVFDMTKLAEYLNRFTDDIDNVELYYNQINCTFKGLENLNCKIERRSIFDKSELK